jgi:nitrite reductase/ring-hydroxylating ferredoxin subunit
MTTESVEIDGAAAGITRRAAFGMCSLGVLGAAGLAACGSDSDASSSGSDAAATGGTAGAGDGAAGGGAASALVKESQVPVGSAVSVESGGKPLIVSMPAADAPVAFQAVCPHKFVTVLVKGDQLVCPAHGSTFDIKTGANLSGPAAGKPLPKVEVKVVNGEIVKA